MPPIKYITSESLTSLSIDKQDGDSYIDTKHNIRFRKSNILGRAYPTPSLYYLMNGEGVTIRKDKKYKVKEEALSRYNGNHIITVSAINTVNGTFSSSYSRHRENSPDDIQKEFFEETSKSSGGSTAVTQHESNNGQISTSEENKMSKKELNPKTQTMAAALKAGMVYIHALDVSDSYNEKFLKLPKRVAKTLTSSDILVTTNGKAYNFQNKPVTKSDMSRIENHEHITGHTGVPVVIQVIKSDKLEKFAKGFDKKMDRKVKSLAKQVVSSTGDNWLADQGIQDQSQLKKWSKRFVLAAGLVSASLGAYKGGSHIAENGFNMPNISAVEWPVGG